MHWPLVTQRQTLQPPSPKRTDGKTNYLSFRKWTGLADHYRPACCVIAAKCIQDLSVPDLLGVHTLFYLFKDWWPSTEGNACSAIRSGLCGLQLSMAVLLNSVGFTPAALIVSSICLMSTSLIIIWDFGLIDRSSFIPHVVYYSDACSVVLIMFIYLLKVQQSISHTPTRCIANFELCHIADICQKLSLIGG